MFRNRFGLGALAGAVLFLFSGPAAKATLINFDFETTSGNPFSIIGQLTIANVLDAAGGFDVLGISGTVFGAGGAAISSLVNNPNQPFQATSSDGLWFFDNVGFSGSPHFDNNGILFTAGGYSYNIYSPNALGGPENVITGYFLSSNNPSGNYIPGQEGTLVASNAPELSTWAMMLIGFAGVGFVAYRRAQKATLATV
jgi:hypothetical protein